MSVEDQISTLTTSVGTLIGEVRAYNEANTRDHDRYESTHETLFDKVNSLEISRGKLVVLIGISGLSGGGGGYILQHLFK